MVPLSFRWAIGVSTASCRTRGLLDPALSLRPLPLRNVHLSVPTESGVCAATPVRSVSAQIAWPGDVILKNCIFVYEGFGLQFSLFVISVSGVVIRVMLASENQLGSIPLL